MTSAERLRARRFGLLFLLGTSVRWGLNWPAMKLLLQQLPPLLARGSARLVSINKVLMADNNTSLKAKVGASGTVTLASLTSRRPTS